MIKKSKNYRIYVNKNEKKEKIKLINQPSIQISAVALAMNTIAND